MSTQYKIGFARPALLRETVLVAQVYQQYGDWGSVKANIRESNLLQTRTVRSSDIMYSEIQKRLSLLNEHQVDVISKDNSQDVRQLVWIAI